MVEQDLRNSDEREVHWPEEARCSAKRCQAHVNQQRAVSSAAPGQGHSGRCARPPTDESRCHCSLFPNSAPPVAAG